MSLKIYTSFTMFGQKFLWGAGVVDGVGVTVKDVWLGWWGVKESFQKHLEIVGGGGTGGVTTTALHH